MFVQLLLLITAVAAQSSIRGKTLKCCTVEAAPYVFVNSTGQFDGLAIDYLKTLEKDLEFKCDLTSFQAPNDTGWNALVQSIADCSTEGGRINESRPECGCELGVSAFFENEDRVGVDFLPPFIHDSLYVLINVKDSSLSMSGAFFLTAFAPMVWVCVCVLIVAFTFLKMLDRRFAPPDVSFVPLSEDKPKFSRVKYYLLKSKIPYRLRRAVQSTLSRMIGQGSVEIRGDNGSTRQWVLNFAIALSGIFLILSYEATMTASLVQEKVQSDYRRVSDLQTCRIPGKDICFVRGDVTQSFWDNSIKNQPCRKVERYPRLFDNYNELFKALAERKCKFIISGGGVAGNLVNNQYCAKMIVTGQPFFRSGLSFILPHNSPFRQELRKASLRLKGEDTIGTLEGYFEGNECQYRSSPTLTFNQLAVFFILAFSACAVIFCEMVIDPQTAWRVAGKEQPEEEFSEVTSVDAVVSRDTLGEEYSDV